MPDRLSGIASNSKQILKLLSNISPNSYTLSVLFFGEERWLADSGSRKISDGRCFEIYSSI